MTNIEVHAKNFREQLLNEVSLEKEKIRDLENKVIPDLSSRLKETIEEGDLRENAGYHSVRDELDLAEKRLSLSRQKLNTLTTINLEDYESDGFIGVGTTVILCDESSKEEYVIMIVPQAIADARIRLVSKESPVGLSISGKQRGDLVVVTSNSKIIEYKVMEVY